MHSTHIDLLVDLGNGDQGKGKTVDARARRFETHTVVRFNGAGQAAHNVVTPDGRHHTFAQFGAGTFAGAATHVSSYMLVQPWAMLAEEAHLREVGIHDAFERATIDDRCLVITPFHRAGNQLRETMRGKLRHGSCGIGVGETMMDALHLGDDLVVRMRDLRDFDGLRKKLERVRAYKLEQLHDFIQACRGHTGMEEVIWDLESAQSVEIWMRLLVPFIQRARIVDPDYLARILHRPGHVIFEPAQGVLLDQYRGFHPYTTWSTCTLDNANALLKEAGFEGTVTRLGIVRAYATRHGPGPFPSEDPILTTSMPDLHNTMGQWQREFRIGHFDAPLTRYAINCVGRLDGLVVTCLDRLADQLFWSMVKHYTPNLPNDAGFFEGRSFLGYRDIHLGPLNDLMYQERLTRALERVDRDVVATASALGFDERVEEHLEAIEFELGLPVVMTSYGPAAQETRYLKE